MPYIADNTATTSVQQKIDTDAIAARSLPAQETNMRLSTQSRNRSCKWDVA
jgi:hypothetical protein